MVYRITAKPSHNDLISDYIERSSREFYEYHKKAKARRLFFISLSYTAPATIPDV